MAAVVLAVTSVLINLGSAAPASVENAAPAAYQPSREAWHVEAETSMPTPDVAYQARDAWDK